MSAEIPKSIGKYLIQDRIGSGGMGHVYLGQDPESGSQVAVKVLTAGLAREGGFVERFNREIDAMRKLTHPNIVRLYDSGIDGENYFFAMEYVKGETLLGLLRRVRRVPWRRAFELAIEICQALKVAHDHGIIHRDLKPSNLLLDSQDHVRLTDFGVAQVFDTQRLTVTGGVIGTAEYMSPEQAEGKRATKQSDLYSLGVVLYVMITGRTPFSGNSTVEVMQKHRFGLFDRPRSIVPELPPRVDETICKLLEKDPQKRFPDAYVLLRHLRFVLQAGDRVSQDLTMSTDSEGREAATTSVAGANNSAGVTLTSDAGEATLMKGLLREELESQQRGHPVIAWLSTLPALIGLLAALTVGVWWMWPRQPTEEQLFERGVRLMQQGMGLNYLQARKEAFQPLLDRNPSGWQDRVAPYLQEIELYELERKPRRSNSDAKSRSIAKGLPDDEPRRLIRRALDHKRSGDLNQALRILSNLRQVLKNDPEQAAVQELVDRLLLEVSEDPQLFAAVDFVDRMLARALEAAQQGDGAAAGQLIQALRNLYGESSAIERRLTDVERQIAEEILKNSPSAKSADRTTPENQSAVND